MNLKRPIGVTIIAILMIINGSFLLLSGLSSFVMISSFNSNTVLLNTTLSSFDIMSQNSSLSNQEIQAVMENFHGFLYFVGILLVIFSIVHFFIAYGLLRAKSWARKMTIILAIVGILTNLMIILIAFEVLNLVDLGTDTLVIFAGNIFTILVNTIIIYYLSKKEVKNFFLASKNKFPSDTFSSLDDLR